MCLAWSFSVSLPPAGEAADYFDDELGDAAERERQRAAGTRRCANAAELRSALDEEGTCASTRKWRRACRLAAAVHGVVLGPAYVSHPPRPRGPRLHPFFFVERAQLYVELYEDEAGAAMSEGVTAPYANLRRT